MYFDFTLILVVATLISGLVVLADLFWLKKRRQEQKFKQAKPSWLVDYSNSFFPVLAIILVLRSFIFEPFQIPSGSMLPTLKIGDFILVNKFSYGVRLPVIHTKIIEVEQPKAGEVAVFRFPLNERQNYIKRIIATPGDKFSFRNNVIYLNGEPLERELLESGPTEAPDEQLWQEQLGEASYQVYHYPLPNYQLPEIKIPEGYYLVMGDNRDHSSDSRFWCQASPLASQGCFEIPGYRNGYGQPLVVGLVAERQLVGKAIAVWLHWPKFFSLPKITAARLIN